MAPLNRQDAERLTARIKACLEELLPLIKQAWDGRADEALGYASWEAYCAAELGGVRVPLPDRRRAVQDLTTHGMSQRAVASSLGVGKRTVERDLAGGSHEPPAEPTRTTGTDGKTYTRERKLRAVPDLPPQPEPAPQPESEELHPLTPTEDPEILGRAQQEAARLVAEDLIFANALHDALAVELSAISRDWDRKQTS